jgi:hypothetical protein
LTAPQTADWLVLTLVIVFLGVETTPQCADLAPVVTFVFLVIFLVFLVISVILSVILIFHIVFLLIVVVVHHLLRALFRLPHLHTAHLTALLLLHSCRPFRIPHIV